MDTRDKLMGLISDGIDVTQISDNSNKCILIRGCDPEMGRRAIELLTPVLGNPEMVAVTNDDDFRPPPFLFFLVLIFWLVGG